MYKILLIGLFSVISLRAQAESKWEVSIGSTQMVVVGVKNQTFPLPTASSTLILSRTIYENFALWAIMNFPLTVNKRLTSEGVVVEDQTPPVAMLGASYTLLESNMGEGKSVGLDTGVSLGRTVDIAGQYFPVGAFRVKLIKDQDSTLFAGVTASPYNKEGDMVWGVIYGMGYRF